MDGRKDMTEQVGRPDEAQWAPIGHTAGASIVVLDAGALWRPNKSDARRPSVIPYASLEGPVLLADTPDELRAYASIVDRHPILREQAERELSLQARGLSPGEHPIVQATADAASRILIAHNLRLALRYAFEMASPWPHVHEVMSDIVQVANLALVACIPDFDPDIAGLANYARYRIRGELRRWVARESLYLAGDDRYRIRRDTLKEAERQEIEKRELAGEDMHVGTLGITLTSVDEMVHDPPDAHTGAAFARVEERLDIEIMLRDVAANAGVSARELSIIRRRYVDDLTQDEIAAQDGVSRQMISVVENRGLRKIRIYYGAESPPVKPPSSYSPEAYLGLFGVAVATDTNPPEEAMNHLHTLGLSPLAMRVIALRYGFDAEHPGAQSPQKISDLLGIGVDAAKYYYLKPRKIAKKQAG